MSKEYDLEERTLIFSENLLDLVKKIPKNVTTSSLIDQLIRSGTNIGSNYREANGASSKKDFKNKIYICKKEAKETMYWIRLIVKVNPEVKDESRILWKEAYELTKIFSKIVSTINKN
ncbi:four helix bundle protein [Candidatus Gottesmanbacteria bacterium]|nr:four helix bundle protein [Candidatus Gottesmanbacteria bacterium]